MDFSQAANVLNMMLALIISLTFHEAGHALLAKLQGDPTAANDGRLTLNPVPHIDPVGTLIFPFIGALLGGFIFGWAKPVPIDSRNFRNQKWGNVIVAASGPATNLLLSFLCVIIVYAMGNVSESSPMIAFYRLTQAMILINAILAIFNMIPVYPLDGGVVLYEFLSYELKQKYDQYVVPYGSIALLGLMLLGGFAWIGSLARVWIFFSDRVVSGLIG